MKKITKLTVGALAFAMFGLTSCVQDDVTPEVQEIYKNQLSLLEAKTKVANAEAALAESNLKLTEAKNDKDIARFAQEVIENELKHAALVVSLQSALDAANTTEAATYAGKYLQYTNEANDARQELAAEEVKLKNALASNTVIVDKEQAVAGQERAIVGTEKEITSKEEEIAMFESFMSDTSTYENQILTLQKKKDALDEAIEDKEALVKKLKEDRDNAQLKSGKIEISESMYDFLGTTLGVAVATDTAPSGEKYTTSYSNVLNAKNELDQKIDNFDNTVASYEANIVNNQDTITTAFSPSGVAPSFINRAEAKKALLAIKNAKASDLAKANDTLGLVEDVIEDYSNAIANYATATFILSNSSTTVVDLKSQLNDLEADYNEVKTAYLADPTVRYIGLHYNHKDFSAAATPTVLAPNILDPVVLATVVESNSGFYGAYPNNNSFDYINFDNQVGNLSDTNPRSWMQVTSVSGGVVTVNPSSIQTSTTPSLGVGETAHPYYSEFHRDGTPIPGIAVNDWIDVEEDDYHMPIGDVYSELQRRYNLMKSLIEKLEADNKPISDFAQSQLDLINKYDTVTLDIMLVEARKKQAEANTAHTTALANYNKFIDGTVDTAYDNLNTNKEGLATTKQNHEEILANKVEFDALVALANDMVSDPMLAELKALEEQIAAINVDILDDQREANSLQRQISYIKAFAEPNDVVDVAYGDTYTGNMLAIKAKIKSCKTDLINLQERLEDEKAMLAYLQSKDATAEEVKAYIVKRIEDRIAKLTVKVAAKEALAAKYFALWEKYINA